jgi:hypothetical protein
MCWPLRSEAITAASMRGPSSSYSAARSSGEIVRGWLPVVLVIRFWDRGWIVLWSGKQMVPGA